jgi:hypothetical protein
MKTQQAHKGFFSAAGTYASVNRASLLHMIPGCTKELITGNTSHSAMAIRIPTNKSKQVIKDVSVLRCPSSGSYSFLKDIYFPG